MPFDNRLPATLVKVSPTRLANHHWVRCGILRLPDHSEYFLPKLSHQAPQRGPFASVSRDKWIKSKPAFFHCCFCLVKQYVPSRGAPVLLCGPYQVGVQALKIPIQGL